jgi:hypothetical protein
MSKSSDLGKAFRIRAAQKNQDLNPLLGSYVR